MRVIILKPVKKFLDDLDNRLVVKVQRRIFLLQEYGYNVMMPVSKCISRDLYELRVLGSVNVRIFYTFHDGYIWLLHGFIKTTQKIPTKELNVAKSRLRNLDSL